MKPIRRSYNSKTDLDAALALKQVCTTPQNIFDRPTVSDLRKLLAPIAESLALTSDKTTWQEALQGMSLESRHRAATQRLTALWEDVRSQLIAFALMIQPGCILTFQIHPEVQGQGLEAEILAWGLEQTRAFVQARGGTRELWCRCHESEHEYRSALEAAGFSPFPERDLRLIHSLASPLHPTSLAEGFSLKLGVTMSELNAYQELHQAVFDGMSMGMEYYQSSAYQPELDLIAVEPTGRFEAFCKCELKRVADKQGEHLVGEVGVIGTRPELRRRGLGQALLLRGLRQMQVDDATSAFLETQEQNVSAQRLFTSVGFTHLSTWQWYIKTVEPFSPSSS
jgi:mycothiol synthase